MILRSLPRTLLVGLVVTALIPACGDDDAEKAKEAEASAEASFITDYCTIITDCCGRVFSSPKNDPTCKDRIKELDPKMVADAKAREACLAQLRAAAKKDDFCTEFGNIDQPACPDLRRKEIAGAKKQGDACTKAAECAPSFEGVVTCNAVCQLTKRGKEGDGPCVASWDGRVETRLEDASGPDAFVCYSRDGLVCDPGSKKCVKPIALGAACTDSGGCDASAYCDPDAKTCKTRKGEGSSCKADECQGPCVDGFCAERSKEGGDCKSNVMCAADLACNGGKCAKPPADARLEAVCVAK